MSSEAWQALTLELDAWQADGKTVDLWLRDDDATEPSESLDRLLRATRDVPLALAVIPAAMQQTLIDAVGSRENIEILPHGFRHRNYEEPPRKKCEFGSARNLSDAVSEIAEAARLLSEAFSARYVPLFVPPWNRIAPEIAKAAIADAGMSGISVYNDRARECAVPGLNTHVDLLDWGWKKSTGTARFAGNEACLGGLTAALARRRRGAMATDSKEAVGILTHHLEHDGATWNFLDRLIETLTRHPAARWTTARDAIRPAQTRTGTDV